MHGPLMFVHHPRWSRRSEGSTAEGFSPTARGAYRIIAVLIEVEPIWTGLNAPRNRAPDTVTEINFGLRFAGNGRFVRHGRPGRWSMYL